MYIGIEGSLNEYRVETGVHSGTDAEIMPVAVLSRDEPDDAWYFECIDSGMRYIISVDIDHFMQRKRVWLDYKIEKDGAIIGAISTGLEFSHIAGELFSQFEQNNIRGLVIDNDGAVIMDSSLMQDTDFLHGQYTTTLFEEFSDVTVVGAINTHLGNLNGYWDELNHLTIVPLTDSDHRYMTLAPVKYTGWSVVIFSDSTSMFDLTFFIPIMIAVLLLLIAFAVSSSFANYYIVFKPLSMLEKSLIHLNEHSTDHIYGAERDDELGHLSNTIQDLFNKANIDPLTGLYNRRFMDSSLEHIMGLLSRTEGKLSVLMMDIDYFKRFNDTYGHEAGDKCLQSIAHSLSYTVSRLNDFVVRYGGEEFTMILPNTDSDGAKMFAERILQNVRDLKIPHKKNDAAEHVTISIGVTTGKVNNNQDLGMYLRRADEALYISKDKGRNRFTYLDFSE